MTKTIRYVHFPMASIISGDADERLRHGIQRRRFPAFIHVPKNAGTMIEKTLLESYGAAVGMHAFHGEGDGKKEAVYDTNPLVRGCPLWHTPPREFVPVRATRIHMLLPLHTYDTLLGRGAKGRNPTE